MVVGVCRVTLMVEESHSLKERRAVIRKLKDRVRLKFNCAVADVGDQNAWQEIILAFAVIANDKAFVDTMLTKILAFIEDLAVAKVTGDEKDIVNYGDEELAPAGGWSHWEPEQ